MNLPTAARIAVNSDGEGCVYLDFLDEKGDSIAVASVPLENVPKLIDAIAAHARQALQRQGTKGTA